MHNLLAATAVVVAAFSLIMSIASFRQARAAKAVAELASRRAEVASRHTEVSATVKKTVELVYGHDRTSTRAVTASPILRRVHCAKREDVHATS